MQEKIAYLMTLKSRDIDMCMINALNDDMPREMLLDCLTLYINKDGGYAHGLHIDNYNTNTSVYQIYEAFRLLRMLGFDKSLDSELYDMVINKPMNYLFNRCAPINNRWNANTKSNNDFPHSMLFTYNEENTRLLGLHPTAALAGYILVLARENKAYYKKALAMAKVLIKELYNKDSLTRYELTSYNSLLNSLKECKLFNEEWDKIEEKLIYHAEELLKDGYDPNGVRPLEVAFYIHSKRLDELKNLELDHIIDSIAPHGLWNHNEGWGTNKYAEEDSAMLKWVGAESVNNYFMLKKYGRLD